MTRLYLRVTWQAVPCLMFSALFKGLKLPNLFIGDTLSNSIIILIYRLIAMIFLCPHYVFYLVFYFILLYFFIIICC